MFKHKIIQYKYFNFLEIKSVFTKIKAIHIIKIIFIVILLFKNKRKHLILNTNINKNYDF